MTSWLQPPQLRIGEDSEEHRHATWLELFYDLVFVVAISQLAHNLQGKSKTPTMLIGEFCDEKN